MVIYVIGYVRWEETALAAVWAMELKPKRNGYRRTLAQRFHDADAMALCALSHAHVRSVG